MRAPPARAITLTTALLGDEVDYEDVDEEAERFQKEPLKKQEFPLFPMAQLRRNSGESQTRDSARFRCY